jgi:signal transduction histidine kinase
MALVEFLRTNEKEILDSIEEMSSALAGVRPASEPPKRGLPIFYRQLIHVLQFAPAEPVEPDLDRESIVRAAYASDEPAIAIAAGRPYDVEVARRAGEYGKELQLLGYTLSHVVHAYGAICQSITQVAIAKNATISNEEFRELNRCLDTAIAGAVTAFHAELSEGQTTHETQHLGSLVHELRNGLAIVTTALRVIKNGTVGFGGSTGQVLDRALNRIQELIDRSLMEVRLLVDPKVQKEPVSFFQLIDQVVVAAEVETRPQRPRLEIEIDPALQIDADHYLLFSAVSNLVQNAIKYTRPGGTIRIRGRAVGSQTIVEVEDECGGLASRKPADLFKPFEQHHKNRDGLGLGLTIAQRAIALHDGRIDVENLPGRGCIFRISLPTKGGAAAKLTAGVNG